MTGEAALRHTTPYCARYIRAGGTRVRGAACATGYTCGARDERSERTICVVCSSGAQGRRPASQRSEKRCVCRSFLPRPNEADRDLRGRSGLSPPASGRRTERSRAAGARASPCGRRSCEVARGCAAKWSGAAGNGRSQAIVAAAVCGSTAEAQTRKDEHRRRSEWVRSLPPPAWGRVA